MWKLPKPFGVLCGTSQVESNSIVIPIFVKMAENSAARVSGRNFGAQVRSVQGSEPVRNEDEAIRIPKVETMATNCL